MIYSCDWHRKNNKKCDRKPYVEVFWKDHTWNYICFWHFLYLKLKGWRFAYCRVDTNRQVLEDIRNQLHDISIDLIKIKEKLGIKEPSYYSKMKKKKKNPMEMLWDNIEDDIWSKIR